MVKFIGNFIAFPITFFFYYIRNKMPFPSMLSTPIMLLSRRKLTRLVRHVLMLAIVLLPPILLSLYWLQGWAEIRAQLHFSDFYWPVLGDLDPRKPAPPQLNPWNKFVPMLVPSCAFDHLPRDFDNKFVLIVVKSGPDREERRQTIRETWGVNGEREHGFHFRTVFVLGAWTNSTDHGENLRQEADMHGDLLVGDFVDDQQRNNTNKPLLINARLPKNNKGSDRRKSFLFYAIGLARRYCGSPRTVPFLLIIEDDTIMLPWNLAKLLTRRVPDEQLYMGKAMVKTVPVRSKLSERRVLLNEYPFDRYPDYVLGKSVLLSGWSVGEFSLGMPYGEKFRLDDVWLGIVAHYMHVKVRHNKNFMEWYDFNYWKPEAWQKVVVASPFSVSQIRHYFGRVEAERNAQMERERAEELKEEQAEMVVESF